jgi:hypothetical protein
MNLNKHLDEVSPGAVVLAGVLLIVFPEPATAALGAGLFLFGLA